MGRRRGAGCVTRARESPPPNRSGSSAASRAAPARPAAAAPDSGSRSSRRSRKRTVAGSGSAPASGPGPRSRWCCRFDIGRGETAVSRILIVEDEGRLASFLEKGLRSSGITTTTAIDGASATTTASDTEFDLMILDLGLPDRDGLDVLRDVRASGIRMPVIILTARGEPTDKVAGLEAGADDYLAKPFHRSEEP